jgi:hypothetical protein
MHKVARDHRNGTSLGAHVPVPTDEEDVRLTNTGVSHYYVLEFKWCAYVSSNVKTWHTQSDTPQQWRKHEIVIFIFHW